MPSSRTRSTCRRDRSARRSRARDRRRPSVRRSCPRRRPGPRSTTTARSQRSSTRSSWCDENSTVAPRRASATSTLERASTATGSRPENGSSRTSTSGSWISAPISWTRCWLPSERSSSSSLGTVGEARARPSQLEAASVAASLGQAAQLAEEHELVERPSSSGTGRAPRAGSRSGGGPRGRSAGRPSAPRRRRGR